MIVNYHCQASGDGTVKMWDIRSTEAATLTINCGYEAYAIDAHGDLIAVGLQSGVVQIWDARMTTSRPLQE